MSNIECWTFDTRAVDLERAACYGAAGEEETKTVTTTHDPSGGGGVPLPPPSPKELADARERFEQLIISVRQRLRLDVPDLTDGTRPDEETEPDTEAAVADAERTVAEVAVSNELVELACLYGFQLPDDVRITISGDASTGVIGPEGELLAVLRAIRDASDRLSSHRMWRRVVHTQLPEQDIEPLLAALRAAERDLFPLAHPHRE